MPALSSQFPDATWQANAITGLGQPALLYLVPLTLGSVALTAAARGDVQRILEFKDSTPK